MPRGSTSARWRSGRRRSARQHPEVAKTLNNLAVVYRQGKYADAEGLYKRALAIKEKALGASHPAVAAPSTTWPSCTRTRQVRRRRGALQARAGDPTRRRSAQTTPMWPRTLNNLADVYRTKASTPTPRGSTSAHWRSRRRRSAKTTPTWLGPSTTWPSCTEPRQVRRRRGALQARAGDPREGAWPRPSRCGRNPHNLARCTAKQGKYADAEGLYKRALAIREKALGADHPDVASTLDNLAILSASSGNSENALAYSRKATASVIAHAATETTGAQRKEGAGGLVEQRTDYFVRHVANLAAAAQKRLEPEAQLGREALVMAQWAKQSAAAAAVQQMGLRFAAGTDALAALVRERQDLSAFWRDRDKALLAALSKPQGQQNADRDRRIAQGACRDREQARCQHGAARTGVPRICGAGKPEAARGRGSAAIARRR